MATSATYGLNALPFRLPSTRLITVHLPKSTSVFRSFGENGSFSPSILATSQSPSRRRSWPLKARVLYLIPPYS